MTQKIIVNKFGGGILNKTLIPFIEARLKEQTKANYSPVVVVSALPGMTDELLTFLNDLKVKAPKKLGGVVTEFVETLRQKHSDTMTEIKLAPEVHNLCEVSLETLFLELEKLLTLYASGEVSVLMEDKIIAYGEKLSATLFTYYLTSLGFPAKRILAEEVPITTDDHFKNANILYQETEENIQNLYKNLFDSKKELVTVIPGFTGMTKEGKTTTLGRGGTDTTACLLGAALRAEKVILWKDVGGVMSADPRIVKEAKTIPFVSYQEAEEAGKIIHDKAIKYAKLYDTAVEITSLADPRHKTVVGKAQKTKKGTKIVSYKKNLTLFILTDENIKGNDMLALTSQAFVKHKVEVILNSNTRYSLQIVADNANGMAGEVFKDLEQHVFKVEAYPVSMVFLVGSFDMEDVNEFNTLLIKQKADMEISAFFYKNCTRLEAVIKDQDIEKIIKALHKKFIK